MLDTFDLSRPMPRYLVIRPTTHEDSTQLKVLDEDITPQYRAANIEIVQLELAQLAIPRARRSK